MRFEIRDILWLTLVVGLALGWWLWWLALSASDVRVEGTIFVGGSPLDDGRICFLAANGQIFGSTVAKSNYTVQQIPAGDFRVAIDGKGVPVRYGEKSSLAVTIRAGKNVCDFQVVAP